MPTEVIATNMATVISTTRVSLPNKTCCDGVRWDMARRRFSTSRETVLAIHRNTTNATSALITPKSEIWASPMSSAKASKNATVGSRRPTISSAATVHTNSAMARDHHGSAIKLIARRIAIHAVIRLTPTPIRPNGNCRPWAANRAAPIITSHTSGMTIGFRIWRSLARTLSAQGAAMAFSKTLSSGLAENRAGR